MKKFLIAIFLMVVLLSGTKPQNDFSLLDYFSGEYCVYTQNEIDENSLNLGFCYMSKSKGIKDKIGESIEIKDLEIGKALSDLQANVVKSECLPDGTMVLYAHTDLIQQKVQTNKGEVNLQIALKNDTCIIGWPLIMGSF